MGQVRKNNLKIFEKNQIPIAPNTSNYVNKSFDWYLLDSKENYNLSPHPYYSKGFTYKFNKQGYRCDDFNLNDKYKILTIGCSVSFGLGLPIQETYPYIICNNLSKTTNCDIKNYNLSVCGASMDYISRTLFQTIDIIKPNYVILFFPDKSRFEYYEENNSVLINSNSKKITKLYSEFLTNETYCFFNFVKNFHFIKEILDKRKIKWFWGSWEEGFIESIIKDKDLKNDLLKYIDLDNIDLSEYFVGKMINEFKSKPKKNKNLLARDWTHPGKDANIFFANYLYERILKENIF